MMWEAGAVLAAILVAFGLDAWWGERVERRAMLDALDAVAVEVRRNLTLFDSASALNRRQIAVARDLITKSVTEVEGLSPEDVLHYGGFPEHEILTLERGALTAFIEGGFLQAVSDDELRAVIAGIAVVQDELNEERAGVGVADGRLVELTTTLMGIDDMLAESPVDVLRAYLVGIAGDDMARKAVYMRTFSLTLYTDEMDRLGAVLAESLAAIERGIE